VGSNFGKVECEDRVKLRVEDVWLYFGGVAALLGVSFEAK